VAPAGAAEARAHKHRLIAPSPGMAERQGELSRFLFENFYNQYQVRRMRRKASRFVGGMFELLTGDPELLPPDARRWVDEQGVHRGVCDFIAGMTDREAVLEYRRLFHPDLGASLE
jgi:dGTPase